jgi:poly-gamma-glutamate synthesis protein (capsule biosynthesis protein)
MGADRRRFVGRLGKTMLGALTMLTALTSRGAAREPSMRPRSSPSGDRATRASRTVTLFLAGDVMCGRGIDQILPHPSPPGLFEPHVRSALDYVELAERASGPIPRPQDFAYVWGDALAELDRRRPRVRIVNLETAVTTSGDAWPARRIHYRMHPGNVPVLTAAGIDCCALANNHTLDWGYRGLAETLDTLHGAGIRTAGAARSGPEAEAPATVDLGGRRRLLVFAFGTESAGVPPEWSATSDRAGVSFLPDLSVATAEAIAGRVARARRGGDLVVVSLHWGSNWGYDVAPAQRDFARRLVETAGVDVVYGHSSHHPRPFEVYDGRLILYGCGDLLNDYEGIAGHEATRPDLTLMHFVALDAETGRLAGLDLVPMQIRRFRLQHAAEADAGWLEQTLNRNGRLYGVRVERRPDQSLVWRP